METATVHLWWAKKASPVQKGKAASLPSETAEKVSGPVILKTSYSGAAE